VYIKERSQVDGMSVKMKTSTNNNNNSDAASYFTSDVEIFKRKLLPAVAPSSLCINLSKVLSKEVQEYFNL
jgi:hypothetical protein